MAQNNIFDSILQSIAPNQNVRDYQHGARMFVDGLYRLSPKLSSLYHVFIDVNHSISRFDQLSQVESGMMAKRIDLPKFTIQNKVHNAYNRKQVQQEKVNYDPVTIAFHDDSTDIIRSLWYDYFTYYYRDSDYRDPQNYTENSKYKQRQKTQWGFSPKSNDNNMPYINSIRVYSLHQKRFSSYTFVRPMILNFSHGQHEAGAYQPMEHTMTVGYEAVLYDTGPVSNGTVMGFQQVHYDNTPSPLRNAGSLINQGKSIFKNIKNGDFGSAVQNSVNVINILKGTNTQIIQTPGIDLSSIGNNVMKGQNPFSSVFAPTSATVQQGLQASTYNNKQGQ